MGISTDFQFETAGNTVESSVNWDLAAGSSPAMTFLAVGAAVRVVDASGTSTVVATIPPTKANQRAEISFAWDNLSAALAHTGVVVRYVDQNNFVLARVNHSTNTLELYEHIAGVQYPRLTFAGGRGSTGFGAMRLEVIGKRARIWHEKAIFDADGVVRDRPPDAAVSLGKDYSDSASYGWGIYMSAGGSNGMQITSFRASGLPRAVLPPPMLQVANATAYDFTPLTLTASNFGTPALIEWEVMPVDFADFPEPYVALTSSLSCVVFVRSGYNYDVRARPVDGYPGVWSAYTRVNAIGSPNDNGTWTQNHDKLATNWASLNYGTGAEPTPPLADIQFPNIAPDYVLESPDTSNSVIVSGTTGEEWAHTPEIRPRRGFQLIFENRISAQYQQLLKFFDYCKGRQRAFNWTHPILNEQFVMCFEADRAEVTYNAQSLTSPIARVTLPITEASVGVVPTYAFRLRADPSL